MGLERAVLGCILLVAAAGCDGPPSPSKLKDEPVCANFTLGRDKTPMHGGLKKPLVIKVMEGKTAVQTINVYGRPSETTKPTLFLLPDANTEYQVEFFQCQNVRAPQMLDAPNQKDKSAVDKASNYKCGDSEGKPYATAKLVTKKGDAESRTIAVPAPPDTECWVDDEVSTEGSATPSAAPSASAPPVAEPPPAPTTSAEPAPSASAAPSTSAAPSAAPSSSAKPASSAKPKAK